MHTVDVSGELQLAGRTSADLLAQAVVCKALGNMRRRWTGMVRAVSVVMVVSILRTTMTGRFHIADVSRYKDTLHGRRRIDSAVQCG